MDGGVGCRFCGELLGTSFLSHPIFGGVCNDAKCRQMVRTYIPTEEEVREWKKEHPQSWVAEEIINRAANRPLR